MKKHYDFFSIASALSRCLFTLATFIFVPNVISILARLILGDSEAYENATVPIMMASYVIVILAFALIYKFSGQSLFEVIGLRKTNYSVAVSSGLLGVGAYGVVQAIVVVSTFILPKSWLSLQDDHASSILSGGIIVAVIYTVLVAPFCEELVFRGLITGAFSGSMPRILAIIIPAVLFSLIHLPSPIALFSTLLLGILLGFIRLRTKSLLPCILIHCLFNATNYMLFIPRSIGLYIVWAVSIPFIILAIINILKKCPRENASGTPLDRG